MTEKQWRATIWKAAVVTLLLCCFGYQVKDSVAKFLRKQKTMALSTTTVESAIPPPISFCPGFKPSGRRTASTFEQLWAELVQFLDDREGRWCCFVLRTEQMQ